MNMIETQTKFDNSYCIRFNEISKKEINGGIDYLLIKDGGSCSSEVGRIRGRQIINLNIGGIGSGTCMHIEIVAHELLHALGIFIFIISICCS